VTVIHQLQVPQRGHRVDPLLDHEPFHRPSMLPHLIIGEMAVSRDRLFVCLQEASGSVWTLDNVDR